MFFIYGLYLEGDEEIRYVGSTCDPRGRFWQHKTGRDQRNPAKEEWVKTKWIVSCKLYKMK